MPENENLKIDSLTLPDSNGNSQTYDIDLPPNNRITKYSPYYVTATGIQETAVAADGSGVNVNYTSAKININNTENISLYDGLILIFKNPLNNFYPNTITDLKFRTTGVTIDGTNYHPIITHDLNKYSINSTIAIIYNSSKTGTLYFSSNTPTNIQGVWEILKYENNIYYGTCSTGAGTRAKDVKCDNFILKENAIIYIKMTNGQTYNASSTANVTLDINNTGAKNLKIYGTTAAPRYCWMAGEIIGVVYDGTNYVMIEGGVATTTYYGMTKLTTGATSTSTSTALTPASLNNFGSSTIAPLYSASSTYNIGDIVRYSYSLYKCNTNITTAEAWTASHWTIMPTLQEQINGRKLLQTAVTSPTANGSTTAFIDTISQNENGDISVTKKNLDTSGTWTGTATNAETAYINNNSNIYYLTGAENTTAGNKELKISPLLKYEASAEPIAHINSQNVEYSDITYKNVSLTIGSVEDDERSVSSLILTSYDHDDNTSYTGLQYYGAISIPNLQDNGEYHLPDSLNGDSSVNWIAIGNKSGVGGPETNNDDQIVGYWLMHLDETGVLTKSSATLGSTVKPIYLFGGRLKVVDYELKATVNEGTQTNNVGDTQYLAYYFDEHNIKPAKERTSTSLISTIRYTDVQNNTTHDVPEGLELINASVESSLKYSASNGLDSWKTGIKTGVSQDIENLTGQDLSSYNTNNANLINNSFGFYNCKNYGNNTDHSGLKAYFTETGHFIINNTNKEKSVGLSLWGERDVTGQGVATAPNYGIFIASPDFYGKFGDVQGDLTDTNNSKTMYFTMDNISNNGWLWKCNRNTNQTSMAASLSCRGVFTAKSFAKNDDYNHTFILIPDGGTRLLNSSSSSLSVLKITLPIGPSYRMFQFVIDIYGYNVGKVSYHIAAYTNNSGWSNVKAHSYGLGDNLNLPIKCGVDANNKLFVALGDNTTSWSYPIVAVRNIQAGTYETTTQEIACGWSMNFVSPSSIESLIQKTISDPALNRPNNFLDSSNNFSPRLAFYSDKNHLDPTEKIIYNNTTGVLQITNGTSDKMLQIDTTCAEASIRLTSNNGNNPPSGDWVIGVNPGGNIANPSEGNIALDEGSFGFYEQKNERLRAYFTKQGHFIINKNTYIQNQEFSTGISLWSEPSDLDVSSTNLTKSPIYGMYISYANIHGKFGDVSNNNHTMYFTLGTTSDPFNQGWIWKVGREIGQNYIAASLSKNGIFSTKGINLYSKDTASQNEINSKFGQIRIVNNLTSNKTYMIPINTSADNLWIAIGGHYDSTGSLCSGVGGSVTNNSVNGYQLMHLNTNGILTASDTTLGSTTKAVYLNQGRLEPLSYKLEANINQGASGDTQYLAYYSAQHEINPTKNRTSKTLISANNVNQVLGLSTTNGECSISYNAGVSGNTSAGHWVVGVNPGGAGANTFGFYEHLSNGGIGTLRASLSNAGVLSVENLITSRGFIRSDNRNDTLSTTSNQYNQTSDNGLFVIAPGRGFLHCRNGTQKGMIKITIPQVNQLTMLSFWVDIYNYNGEVTSYHIGGQKRTSQINWEKCSAYSLGNGDFSNLTVRFVSTSGGSSIYNYAIYIGETTTKWEYCNIVVRDVNLGFQVGDDKTAWNDFIVSIENATLSTNDIKATITNPNVASPYNIKPYTYTSTGSKTISTSWSDLVYYHSNRGPSIPGLYLFTVQFTAPVSGSNGSTEVRFGWGGVVPWMSKTSSYGGYSSTVYPLNYPLTGGTSYTFGFGSNIFQIGAILQHDTYGTRIQIKHNGSGTYTIPAGCLHMTWHYLTAPSASYSPD